MTTSKQRLALAICDFLSTSTTDGTVSADERDSLDVAINCISDSFKIDASDKAAVADAVGDQSLFKIYSVYEKLKGAKGTTATAPASASETPAAAAAPEKEPTAEDRKEADALKSKGNAAMAQKDYTAAVDLYTQALARVPGNAIYLSNRAAAHSAAKNHAKARVDAEAAVAIDPTYTKGWSRLGLAKFALGDAKGAMAAYQKGIEYEGSGGSDAMRKGYETAKRRVDELEAEGDGGSVDAVSGLRDGSGTASPSADGGGNPFAGFGGGGAGMPDLSSVLSNPMFASMAQNMMSNPDLMSNLMTNPQLREMASNIGTGGGMPDISKLMSDPSIADIARKVMGGDGAGRGSGGSQ